MNWPSYSPYTMHNILIANWMLLSFITPCIVFFLSSSSSFVIDHALYVTYRQSIFLKKNLTFWINKALREDLNLQSIMSTSTRAETLNK